MRCNTPLDGKCSRVLLVGMGCNTSLGGKCFTRWYGMRSIMTAPHLELTTPEPTLPPEPPQRGEFIRREIKQNTKHKTLQNAKNIAFTHLLVFG